MSQGEDDGPAPSHDLLLRLGEFINGHRRWTLTFTAGLLPGLAAVLSVVGQELQDRGDWFFLLGAAAAILASALLQLLSGWAADQTAEVDRVEAEILRVTLKDALQPVAEMIAEMELLSQRRDRTAKLEAVANQAVGALKLIFPHIERARATVYRLTDSGDMECLCYQGRGEGVRPQPFVRYTSRGEQALAVLAAGGELRIEDIDAVETASDGRVVSPDYRGTRSGYKTFITCSITNGHRRYGMVTLDAPEPGSLTDTDAQLVGLMADLLAIAFAIEERGSRARGLGQEGGQGTE